MSVGLLTVMQLNRHMYMTTSVATNVLSAIFVVNVLQNTSARIFGLQSLDYYKRWLSPKMFAKCCNGF